MNSEQEKQEKEDYTILRYEHSSDLSMISNAGCEYVGEGGM